MSPSRKAAAATASSARARARPRASARIGFMLLAGLLRRALPDAAITLVSTPRNVAVL
jgi:hypothetical protein